MLYNEGLSYLQLNQIDQGMHLLEQARKEKQINEHGIIDTAIANYGRGFSVFSVPNGIRKSGSPCQPYHKLTYLHYFIVVFRPSDLKVRNLKAKNYLGTAKLVASSTPRDAFVGFSGTGVKATIPKEGDSSSPTDEKERRSPLLTTKSYPSNNATMPPVKMNPDQTAVQPLKVLRKKSSVDLRSRYARSPPPNFIPPANTQPISLPRIDTDVNRPSIANRSYRSHSSPNTRFIPTIAAPMPPTPPDSRDGHRMSPPLAQRSSADTSLGYLDEGLGKRDSDFMDDLVGGYSAIEIDIPGKRPSLPMDSYSSIEVELPGRRPSLPFGNPHPQGQPIERVANWANNQFDSSRVDPSSRYRNPSAPPSVSPAASVAPSRQGTMRRYGPDGRSNGSNGFQSLRKGTLDDYRNATLARKESIDDFSTARMGDMISFRLKLHFENDVRGMVRGSKMSTFSSKLTLFTTPMQSLDVETPYTEFYTRLQSKFGLTEMSLKFKDEDEIFITIADEDDWSSAIDAARENCQAGRHDGKLDIWITEGRSRSRQMRH